jgi:hypothetical protein
MHTYATRPTEIDSPAAWRRLAAAVVIATFGGVGMWSVVVALPAVQAEFGVDRAAASLPYTVNMVGFALGGVLMGRLADRVGIMGSVILGALLLALGYALAGALAGSLWQFALAYGVLIGIGGSVVFGPLMADLPMVRAAAGHRGRAGRERQLPRRHVLAARGSAFRRNGWLARHASGHRSRLRGCHAAALADAASPGAIGADGGAGTGPRA